MNKTIKAFLFIGVCLTFLMACSKDDKDEPTGTKIVGHWECVSGSTTILNLKTGEESYSPFPELYFITGSIIYFYEGDEYYHTTGDIKLDGKYKISDDKMDLIYNSAILTFTIKDLTSEYLQLTIEDVGSQIKTMRNYLFIKRQK